MGFLTKHGGGWDAFGDPEFDGSSISGGAPDTSGRSKAMNSKAAKQQAKINARKNCRKCSKLPSGAYCGKHG